MKVKDLVDEEEQKNIIKQQILEAEEIDEEETEDI